MGYLSNALWDWGDGWVYWRTMMHTRISELRHHYFRYRLGSCSAPSHTARSITNLLSIEPIGKIVEKIQLKYRLQNGSHFCSGHNMFESEYKRQHDILTSWLCIIAICHFTVPVLTMNPTQQDWEVHRHWQYTFMCEAQIKFRQWYFIWAMHCCCDWRCTLFQRNESLCIFQSETGEHYALPWSTLT